jgi:hypothetical protein
MLGNCGKRGKYEFLLASLIKKGKGVNDHAEAGLYILSAEENYSVHSVAVTLSCDIWFSLHHHHLHLQLHLLASFYPKKE